MQDKTGSIVLPKSKPLEISTTLQPGLGGLQGNLSAGISQSMSLLNRSAYSLTEAVEKSSDLSSQVDGAKALAALIQTQVNMINAAANLIKGGLNGSNRG